MLLRSYTVPSGLQACSDRAGPQAADSVQEQSSCWQGLLHCSHRVVKGCEGDGTTVQGQLAVGQPAAVLVPSPLSLPLCGSDVASVFLQALSSHLTDSGVLNEEQAGAKPTETHSARLG